MFRLFAIGGISLAAFFYCLPVVSEWLTIQFPNSWLSSEDAAMLVTGIPTWLVLPAILITVWKHNYVAPPHFQDMLLQPNDPELLKCIDKAKSEIQRFTTSLLSKETNKNTHLVRYSKNTNDFHFLNLWYEVDRFENDQLHLKRLPTEKDVEYEVSQIISLDDIDDWCIMTRKGMKGSYTHLALYKAYLQQHGKHPSLYNEQLNAFDDVNFKTQSFVSKTNKKKKFFTLE